MANPTFGISILRQDFEARAAVKSDMSIIGLIGTAPLAKTDTKAVLVTGSNQNNRLRWTSKLVGILGNAISVQMYNNTGISQPLAVTVLGNAITVKRATNATGGGISTAAEVAAAILASPAAAALVTCVNEADSDGSANVPIVTVINLTGGLDEPYPINTPVALVSSDTDAVANLGATGTLAAAISLINAQLGEFQSAAQIVVVRVTEGVNADATIVNIVGNGLTTGLAAFLAAPAAIGITPRLLAAPGYTSQRTGANANAVCAALPSICSRLLAHAVVDGPATTAQDALNWRATIASERIIPIDPAVKVLSGGVTVVTPLSPAVLGVAVRRDFEFGGRPFHSWANQPVYGVLGPSRPIRFSLTDGVTEAQELLSANIGVLIRAEAGSDGAIADGGFVFIGTDNAGNDDLWRFYNVTRGRDYIHLMLIKTLRTYLGRFNITRQTVQAILNTMELALRDLKSDGDILGYEVKFVPSENSVEDVRQGRIVVNFAAEEAPVLRHIQISSSRYRAAVDALISDLAGATI